MAAVLKAGQTSPCLIIERDNVMWYVRTTDRNNSIKKLNGPKWSQMVSNSLKWSKMVQYGPKLSKTIKDDPN